MRWIGDSKLPLALLSVVISATLKQPTQCRECTFPVGNCSAVLSRYFESHDRHGSLRLTI